MMMMMLFLFLLGIYASEARGQDFSCGFRAPGGGGGWERAVMVRLSTGAEPSGLRLCSGSSTTPEIAA